MGKESYLMSRVSDLQDENVLEMCFHNDANTPNGTKLYT